MVVGGIKYNTASVIHGCAKIPTLNAAPKFFAGTDCGVLFGAANKSSQPKILPFIYQYYGFI